MNFLDDLLFFIYPKSCGICKKIENNFLCEKCERKLKTSELFVNQIIDYEKDRTKYFDEHAFVFKYDSIIRDKIIQYKFNNKAYLSKMFFEFFVKNKKICGMLIENDLMGRTIRQSISGIGINVNQEAFHSSAPNPVSLQQITGKQYEIFGILRNIMLRVQSYYELLRNDDTEFIANRYEKALFRKEGMHRYKDPDGEFFARIVCVEPEGRLILEDETLRKRGYMFKEVEYILK